MATESKTEVQPEGKEEIASLIERRDWDRLAKIGDPAVQPVLQALEVSRSDYDSMDAVRTLGQLHSPAALPALADRLEHVEGLREGIFGMLRPGEGSINADHFRRVELNLITAIARILDDQTLLTAMHDLEYAVPPSERVASDAIEKARAHSPRPLSWWESHLRLHRSRA